MSSHHHQFREITNVKDRKKGVRVYRCNCGYTLEERKIQGRLYFYVLSKEEGFRRELKVKYKCEGST